MGGRVRETRFLDRTTPPHVMTLVALSAMSALAMNVFLPSLPAMAAYFDTSYSVMQLSVSLYLGVTAVLQLVIGTVSDRYGRRPVLLVSLVVFLLATLGTMLAPSAEIFLVFRMMQGAIISAIALSRAAIRDVLDEAQAASRIGYVTMGMALVPMVAPAIGGLLEGLFGWRGSFGLMLVAGSAVLTLAFLDMGETKQTRGGSFGALLGAMPELLRSPRFWAYCATATLGSGAFFAYLGGAPFVGARVFGMSPAELGLFFGAPAIGYAAGNFLSGRFAGRVGINRMIIAGVVVAFAGMSLLVGFLLTGAISKWSFFGSMIFIGLGNGMMLPSATSGMMSVRPHLAGSASGLGGAIMVGGGAALSALAGVLLTEAGGAGPLIWLMWATTGLGLPPMLYVMARARRG